MILHRDWKNILMKAWSIRLMLLAGLINGLATYWPAFAAVLDPRMYFAVGVLISVLAVVARVIDQQDLDA